MPNAKGIGWAIYAAGFAIWLFGYLSAGHAPAFDWVAATPWWISTFVPNLEAVDLASPVALAALLGVCMAQNFVLLRASLPYSCCSS
jgi:hypothetical protein